MQPILDGGRGDCDKEGVKSGVAIDRRPVSLKS
jgi:hypothetical protein